MLFHQQFFIFVEAHKGGEVNTSKDVVSLTFWSLEMG